MAMQHDPLRSRLVQRFLFTAALLLSALALAPGAHAQGPGGMNMSPEERATQRVALLTERLQLTAQQATALKPILVKQFTEQTQLFQRNQGGDFAAMREEMVKLRTKYDAEIAAQLTETQKKAYAAFTEEEAARRRNRMGGGGQ